ncbi:recombinase family protein [Hyphomicrobium sp. MC8b]|uniref:recombinase family protein n=1 Tax=Hyphomicrobium sp. MC8b TaxID=300273 RepID=UPI00391C0472
MTTAAIYVRVSTSRQAERDLSLPDQIAQCRAYCDQRGWQVVEVFSEPGASALDDDRPVFQEMIYKATRIERPYDFVVVHSLSRFSRDALHSELYVRQLRKAGVGLVSITQDIGQDASGEFIRKVLNVFDEHQSRENAKHVHRAMLENARQGFWNGSQPPYGYATEIQERRGTKDKKVLVLRDDEARIMRLIFNLAMGTEGRPMGVKAIATYLNERGITRRGRRFSTGGVHDLLTSSTYCGRHQFNRFDSRNGRPRPPSQWVQVQVPAIVDEQTFNAVQALLQSRNPKRVAPRIVNGPTLLAGVARCGHCGAALIQNTGKGGLYRYYACSRKLKEGATACRGLRMPMDRLDQIVIDEVSARVLHSDRLSDLLKAYLKSANSRSADIKERLSRLRQAYKDAEAGIARLLTLVEQGVMDAEDGSLRERLVGLKVRRDELGAEVADLQKRLANGEPAITPDKIAAFAALLSDKLQNGPPDFRQAYVRLTMQEVSVGDKEIRISGSKALLARAASNGLDKTALGVLSFVQEWRARKDSNL